MKIISHKRRFLIYASCLIIPAVVFTEMTLNNTKKIYLENVLKGLDTLASIQKFRVQEMIYGNYQRVLGVTSRTALRKDLYSYIKMGDAAKLPSIKKILADAQKPFLDIEEIFIYDSEGHVIVSTGVSGDFKGSLNAGVLKKIKDRLSIWPYQVSQNSVELLLTGPILYNDKPIAFLGIIVDDKSIRRIAEDVSGLGESGETVLSKKNERGDAELMHPRRHASYLQSMADIPQNQIEVAMIQALLRYEGTLSNATDYRGEPVFAATRYIVEEDWGIVVKMDQKEVLGPIVQVRHSAYKLLFIVLIFWLIVGFLCMQLKI